MRKSPTTAALPIAKAAPRAHPSGRARHGLIRSRYAALALLLAPAISAQGSPFQLTSINVVDGQTWKINKPIAFAFNQPVDFATVSLATISIAKSGAGGVPALGEFELRNATTVLFRPACPLEEDLSDAGLAPGGVAYQIVVNGTDTSAGAVLASTAGALLGTTTTVSFTTPPASPPSVTFFDPVVGPPTPVLHTPGSAADAPGTHLVIGGDDGQPIYFVHDPVAGTTSGVRDVPLNLYSDPFTSVAVVIAFDQPVNPLPANINAERLFLERQDPGSGTWTKILCSVELLENCTASGASVELRPIGLLAQGGRFRAVVSSEFEDLIGETQLIALNGFAPFATLIANEPGLAPVGDLADERLEDFATDAFEDEKAVFAEPSAVWENGLLSPATFPGTGGSPDGPDWVIPAGTTMLDTSNAVIITGQIIGPPETGLFAPTAATQVVNGVLELRHLRIDAGGTLRVVGPNPLDIRLTGKAIVNGTFDASGFHAKSVTCLNCAHIPELGAVGGPGGGRGGTGNTVTTSSTPKGGDGFGAFDAPGGGGRGGESGVDSAASGNKENRRAAGGGGGAFGANEVPAALGALGLAAMPGRNGAPNAKGAISGLAPPKGGLPSSLPFTDGNPSNDFFGKFVDPITSAIVVGELTEPFAGAGGGAGGNACPGPTFPTPAWTPAKDEKGAGGGGGGGSLRVRALADIVIGASGRILANGGVGGSGENTIGTDHIGGASGGGSGGHVILETAGKLDLLGTAGVIDLISARGGKFGLGASAAEAAIGAGGYGGPGIVQLHAAGGAASILLPAGETLAQKSAPNAVVLAPSFGATSRARSTWFHVLGASFDPPAGVDPLIFFHGGTDTATGEILDLNGDAIVDDLPAVLGSSVPLSYPPLGPAPVPPYVQPDGRTLVVDASALAGTFDDVYLRNPNLVIGFNLRLYAAANPLHKMNSPVAAARYDHTSKRLTLMIGPSGPKLSDFQPGGDVLFELRPRTYRILSGGLGDLLMPGHSIALFFQAAKAKPDGTPDELAPLVDWTADLASFGSVAPGTLAFVRFEVAFDLGAPAALPGAPLPALDFLRLPFRF